MLACVLPLMPSSKPSRSCIHALTSWIASGTVPMSCQLTQNKQLPRSPGFYGMTPSRAGGAIMGVKMPVRKIPKWIHGWEHWQCSRCEEWKRRSKFYNANRGPSGLSSACRKCKGKYLRKRRIMHRDRLNKKRRDHYQKNKVSILSKDRNRRALCPDRDRAKAAVKYAVEMGRITKAAECEMCGSLHDIQGHHDSYDKDRWLVVIWLCGSCHVWLHYQRRGISH